MQIRYFVYRLHLYLCLYHYRWNRLYHYHLSPLYHYHPNYLENLPPLYLMYCQIECYHQRFYYYQICHYLLLILIYQNLYQMNICHRYYCNPVLSFRLLYWHLQFFCLDHLLFVFLYYLMLFQVLFLYLIFQI